MHLLKSILEDNCKFALPTVEASTEEDLCSDISMPTIDNESLFGKESWIRCKYTWANREIVMPARFVPDIEPFNPTLSNCRALERSSLPCTTCHDLNYHERQGEMATPLYALEASANGGCQYCIIILKTIALCIGDDEWALGNNLYFRHSLFYISGISTPGWIELECFTFARYSSPLLSIYV